MKVIALSTGRAGSSLPGKNTMPVLGRPCAAWGMEAANAVDAVVARYCSSDARELLSLGESLGFAPIQRPAELAHDSAKHEQVIEHALGLMPPELTHEADALLVLMANAPVISADWIVSATDLMSAEAECSAVIPVAQDNDKHPFRARRISPEGLLTSYLTLPAGTSSTRQELPSAYFALHNFWLLRLSRGTFLPGDHEPWPAWGPTPVPLVSKERFCDIHSLDDVPIVEAALQRILEI